MKNISIMVAAALLVGASGVCAARSMEGARDIQTYQKAAQSDVPTMPSSPLVDWQALDGHTLAVWTSNDKPWLVNVDQSCNNLMHAKSLEFTSTSSQIKAGTDSVKFGDTQCKIESIQPVEYSKVAAAHRRSMHHHASKMASNKKTGQ